MYPTLFSFGPISFSSFGACIALAFGVFTFLVWRGVRNDGISDEKIFDNILLVTLIAFIFSRLFFVATHWSIFSPNILRTFLVWKFPGLSFWGGLIGGIATFYILGRRQGLVPMRLFDKYALALPPALFFAAIGIFLDGSLTGKATSWSIGMAQIGVTGRYHPVGVYTLVLALILLPVTLLLRHLQAQKKLGPGFVGWSVLSLLGLGQLLLAFFRSDTLYWEGFSIDYIVATILLIGPWGPIYKEVNGSELLKRGIATLKNKGDQLYAQISKRSLKRN